jgi:hypothetical protein
MAKNKGKESTKKESDNSKPTVVVKPPESVEVKFNEEKVDKKKK